MQNLILMLLKLYKKIISPHLKTSCKFYPTCSEYAILAIKKYGILKGSIKTTYRLLRCNPSERGGIDFP